MYFILQPEVAGGLGELTVVDRSKHPPVVTKLHYEFEGWLGDEILESFPCFIVTAELRKALETCAVTGCNFHGATISASPEFHEMYPNRRLPAFDWLKVYGTAGKDDFGLTTDGRLVISNAALAILQRFRMEHCAISHWKG